jgi:hypothetical protein
MSTVEQPRPRARPSGWWYLLVPLVFLAGLGIAVDRAVGEIRSIHDPVGKVDPSGRGTIRLDAGRTAQIWRVDRSGLDSTDSLQQVPSTATIDGPGSCDATYRESHARMTFRINRSAGIKLGEFTAPVTGTYRFDVDTTPPVPLIVTNLDLLGALARVAGPAWFGTLTAIALFVALFVLRWRSKRVARRAPAGMPPPQPPQSQGPITFT